MIELLEDYLKIIIWWEQVTTYVDPRLLNFCSQMVIAQITWIKQFPVNVEATISLKYTKLFACQLLSNIQELGYCVREAKIGGAKNKNNSRMIAVW